MKLFIFNKKKNRYNLFAIFEFFEKFEIFFEFNRMISLLCRTLCSINTILTIRKTTLFKLIINIDNIKQREFIQLKVFEFIAKKIEIFHKL